MDDNQKQLMDRLDAVEGDLKALAERHDALQKNHDAIVEENAQLRKSIETLGAPAAEAEEPKPLVIPQEPFEVDGIKYKFIVPKFTAGGVTYTAADVLLDKSLEPLLQALVAKKSGYIKKVA